MFKFLSVLLLAYLVTTMSFAQPALPSPGEIFDDIEVVAVQPVVDNVSRTLSIYQDGDWGVLPYPDGLDKIYLSRSYSSEVAYNLIAQRPDETYIFLEQLEDNYSFDVWIANPEIELIYRIESPCNSDDYSFINPWVYSSIGNVSYLCNWITGENSPPLPEQTSWGATHYSIEQPQLSPDGRYLVLRAPFDRGTVYYGNRIYSYNLETQAFMLVGEIIDHYDNVGFGGWLTPTTFIIGASDMPEWSNRNQFVGDVQEINSLHFAISKLRFSPITIQNPLGMMVMGAAMKDGPTPGPCFVVFYDVIKQHVNQYDTGALCDYGIPIPDGSDDQLFRAVYPAAVVVRYNFFTGTRRNLYVGEVETLGAVSPDGHFGLIGLDDNGIVETDQDPDINYGVTIEPSEYTIMDLNTGDILGQVPVDVDWLGANHLYNQEQLFSVTSDSVKTEELAGKLVFTDSKLPAMLLQTANGDLQLHDLSDDSFTTIATIPTGYNAAAQHLREGVIRVTFYSTDLPTLAYDIHLP